MRPTVTLIANSGQHHQQLPEALARAGVLRQAVRTLPDLEFLEAEPGGRLRLVRRFSSHRLVNRIFWAIRRRLPVGSRRIVPMMLWARLNDRRISKWLAPCDVFHGLMGLSRASLLRAGQFGAVTLIDNPTLHPADFRRETMADYADAGIGRHDTEAVMSPSAIAACERQYEQCDKVITYSASAHRSFQRFPYGRKSVVVHPGVDHDLFSPASMPRSDSTFRVCYVGRIEAPKGIHRLVDAWKQLHLHDAELVLVGAVFPEMAFLQSEARVSGIRLTGILPPSGVAQRLRESDLFVFPSVNEGLSLALLQAMSCGLPVVACRGTGAEDCVMPGQEGLLVPGRNTDALSNAILWSYNHRDDMPGMGRAARIRIESEFTQAHYIERLLALYQSVMVETGS